MTGLSATTAALDHATAVRVLADTTDYQTRLPGPAQLRSIETRPRQATAHDPTLTGYAQPGTTADAGELARATLHH